MITNRTQTVYFYNTTGVIEREHNLFYAPRITGTGTYANAWLTEFNSVSKHDTTGSKYWNKQISQWSPEDRVLSIQGEIERFRRKDINSNPFNYLIVKEELSTTENEVVSTETIYTAFFIVDAKQTGVGTVRLELEPDDFTNVFYLQNKEAFNVLFDYNRYIKNTYIERQHYNRVIYRNVRRFSIGSLDDVETSPAGIYSFTRLINKPNNFTTSIAFNFTGGMTTGTHEVVNILDQSVSLTVLDNQIRISGTVTTDKPSSSMTLRYRLDYYSQYIDDDNLDVFCNVEETFKYKRQYRDLKEQFNFGDVLTEAEKETIENTDDFGDLSETLKLKIIKLCASVVHTVVKDDRVLMARYYSDIIITDYNKYPRNKYVLPNVELDNTLIDVKEIIPIIPEMFDKWKDNILTIFYNIYMKDNGTYVKLSDKALHKIPYYSEYITSIFITRDDTVIDEIELEEINNQLSITIDGTVFSSGAEPLNICVVPYIRYEAQLNKQMFEKVIAGDIGYLLYGEGDIKELRINGVPTQGLVYPDGLGYIYTAYPTCYGSLDLSTETPENVKERYYEPLLSFEPYSFYSVSYLGLVETILNKRNYYQNPLINYQLSLVVTDTCKVSFLPTYVINEKPYKYYSEELLLTLNNQLTFSSSNLEAYLIQNRAQMKNQYAVNDMNLGKGLVSGFTTGLGQGARTGVMFGDPLLGLGAGLIQAGAQAVGSVISWGFDKAEIGMNQKAKLADVGNLPDNIKQVGTDIIFDICINEMGLYLNHYTIDELSYNSICKYLERYGYLVNIYDTINDYNRKGWNYIKLVDFEFDINVSVTQEETIRQIFSNGVTLLHEPSYLHSSSLHNYEMILD